MPRSRSLVLFLILALGVAVRVWFNRETHLTLEDSLITFRYAENLADGRGFVYNAGERVLGTTSPLWTLILATSRRIGFTDTIASAKILGVLFDALTIIVLVGTFCRRNDLRFILIWSALFISSSGIVPITTSGMETPLLLFAMALAIRGMVLKSYAFPLGLAMAVMTRIDGLIFVFPFLVAAWLTDHRWGLRQVILTALFITPWFVFSRLYFDTYLPHSIAAKTTVYEFGISQSAAPFLDRFTPFWQASLPVRLVKIAAFVLLMTGTWVTFRRSGPLRPLVVYFFLYCLIFSTSGGMIFPWYMTPATFAHDIILATGAAFLIREIGERIGKGADAISLAFLLIAANGANLTILRGRFDEYREIQDIEEELRTDIGRWLKDSAGPGESVFLEPIGYIGYYAGPDVRIIDEIGIVSPPIVEIRREGAGWYIRALMDLRPDYIVEYTRSLEDNIAEGGPSRLFLNERERNWFFETYRIIAIFEARGDYPHIEDKEKRYTVLKRNIGRTSSGVTPACPESERKT